MLRNNNAISTENQSPVGDKPPVKKIWNIKKQLSRPKVHWKKPTSDGTHSRIDKDAVLSRISFDLLYRTELSECTQSGDEIRALCPFHDDKNPSFNANISSGLFNCHACGESGDVFHFVQKKYNKSFPEALEYLADFAGVTPTKPATLARKELPECPATLENLKTEYRYKDEASEPLFSVFRFEAEGYRKSIRQGHTRKWSDEKIVFRLPDGVARIPYNLDKFSLFDTIFVTEGENKAAFLRRWSLLGTCNPGGAGKWKDEYSQYLKDKHVVILPDNDEPGGKHAQKVAESVLPVAASVKIVELPGLPEKGDLIDWKEAGHNREEFLALVGSTPPLSEVPAEEEKPLLRLYTMDDILNMPMPKWRIERLLPETGLAVIYGTSGSGKSFVCIDMAAALARGDEEWFGFRIVAPCNTLYVVLEGQWGLPLRMKARIKDNPPPQSGITYTIQNIDLRDVEYVEQIIKLAPKKGMVIIDTLNRATPGMDENSSVDMGVVISAATEIQQATEGIVLIVAHTGKDGTKGVRGHSSLIPAIDTSIRIERSGEKRTLILEKNKEGEDGIRRSFSLKKVVVGFNERDEDITSCIVQYIGETDGRGSIQLKSKKLQYGLDSLARAIETHGDEDGWVTLEGWRQEYYKGHTGDNQETKKKDFQYVRSNLAARKIIKPSNDYYSITKIGEKHINS